MKTPVSMFVGLLLFVIVVILAALIIIAVGIQCGDLVEIGDTYIEYGNTRNLMNFLEAQYIFAILVLVTTATLIIFNSTKIKTYLKKKLKKKLR